MRIFAVSFIVKVIVVAVMAVPAYAAHNSAKKSVQYVLDQHSTQVVCRPTTQPGLNLCKDGTYSYVQDGNSWLGDGLCGPTSVATLVANTCGIFDAGPTQLAAYLRVSAGRGTNASQLLQLLRGPLREYQCRGHQWDVLRLKKNQVRWRKGSTKTLSWIVTPYDGQPKRKSSFVLAPAVVALRVDPDVSGHWTLVVDVDETSGCEVVHNTWGRQYRTPCRVFGELMQNGRSVIYLQGYQVAEALP